MAPKTLEGQTLGKYRIIEPLGQGGMAQVYRAYHPTLDRYVAIKVLRSDLIDDQEFLARFSREARSVAALRHPNIVQVFDFDVQDDHYFMVMELLEGNTLKAYLNSYRSKGKPIPPNEIARILSDVLKGLSYAHANGIIHRDIKPANLLLTSRGEAVVTDFGIAQIVGSTQYTVSGALMGTLHYMAPEQGMGTNVDQRSDLYSLGVVLYEMLTGHPPFDADTPLAILMKHLNDPLPLPAAPNPTIPRPFERVLLKALAKQPDERYQNAEEMMRAVQEAAEACAAGGLTGEVDVEEAPALAESAPASETPQVFSGSDRHHITDRQFAGEITDTNLDQHLRPDATGGSGNTTTVPPASASDTLNDVVKAAGALFSSVGGVVSAALVSAAEEVKQNTREVKAIPAAAPEVAPRANFVVALDNGPDTAKEDAAVQPQRVLRAVTWGIGSLVGYNILALMLGTGAGWWGLFQYGWTAELLLIAMFLFLLMSALSQVWLFVPAGILFGNGALLALTSLTGYWGLWGWLWPLELILVGGTIVITSNIARRQNGGRQFARNFGASMAILTGAVVVIVIVGSLGASIIRAFFG